MSNAKAPASTTLPDPFPGQSVVPLTSVAAVTRLNMWQVRKVVNAGLVRPTDKRMSKGRHTVTHADACFLVAAATAAEHAHLSLIEAVRIARAFPQIVPAVAA